MWINLSQRKAYSLSLYPVPVLITAKMSTVNSIISTLNCKESGHLVSWPSDLNWLFPRYCKSLWARINAPKYATVSRCVCVCLKCQQLVDALHMLTRQLSSGFHGNSRLLSIYWTAFVTGERAWMTRTLKRVEQSSFVSFRGCHGARCRAAFYRRRWWALTSPALSQMK